VSPEPYWIASPSTGPILQTELLSNVIEFRAVINSIGTQEENVEVITHPLVMVMTQDCELDLDYKARYDIGKVKKNRLIDSVLLCLVDDAERLRAAHRESGAIASGEIWKAIKINQHERYHVFDAVPAEIATLQTPPPLSLAGLADTAEDSPQEPLLKRWLGALRNHFTVPPPSRPAASQRAHLPPEFRGTLAMDFRKLFTMPMPELLQRIAIGQAVRHCYLSPICRDEVGNRFYGYHMRIALPGGAEPV
jgi:hypothetical protein